MTYNDRFGRQVDGKKMYWQNWSPFQGCGYVFLSTEDRNVAFNRKRGDVLVVEKQRHKPVKIHNNELLQSCPFQEFKDGFYFSHPSGDPTIINRNPTLIPKAINN